MHILWAVRCKEAKLAKPVFGVTEIGRPCSLREIWQLTDDIFAANERWLTQFS